jgi:hypothetical protein
LTVTKNGFEPGDKTIEIAGGRDTALAITLVPQIHDARLVIEAAAAATVSIDGKVVGNGHFEGAERPGTHKISVVQTGMQAYEATIDLRDGEARSLQVTLEAEHHAALWPWIAGGAVFAAGMVVGGYFLFKPSDTVTPVPPGKLATVTFSSWRR